MTEELTASECYWIFLCPLCSQNNLETGGFTEQGVPINTCTSQTSKQEAQEMQMIESAAKNFHRCCLSH